MANLSLQFSPETREDLSRIQSILGKGSIGAIIRRALARYIVYMNELNLSQLQMECVAMKMHRKTKHV